ncbi:hypothetical protein QC764_0083240 [Podospora pseudoanserina]|uniref:F-box domain-containing protein n=1 Tax=Podospora pseudoanserina TaxID=2609844 RepID=A0ABR0I6F8_9PEZI|nr:hypothetical protein QC764_0083240 [Podospora pseudoanserina]
MDCDDNGIRGGSSTRLPPPSSPAENDLVEDIGDLHINSSPSTSYRSLNDLPVEILREIVEELTPHEHHYDWDWDYCSVCHGGEKCEPDESDIRNLRLVNGLFYRPRHAGAATGDARSRIWRSLYQSSKWHTEPRLWPRPRFISLTPASNF